MPDNRGGGGRVEVHFGIAKSFCYKSLGRVGERGSVNSPAHAMSEGGERVIRKSLF